MNSFEPQDCSITEREESQALILQMAGDITSDCEDQVMSAYERMKSQGLKVIILDFKHVSYINSAGIAVFVSLLTKVRQNGHKLLLTELSNYFHKIFTMIGLTRYSDYFSTLEQALDFLHQNRN